MYKRMYLPLFCLLFTMGQALGQVERTITETASLDSDGRVSIDTYKGSIDVQVWDKEEVFLEARIELDDESDEAQEAIDLVEIHIRQRSGSFSVETDYDRLNKRRERWNFWNSWNTELPSVHYTLKIPSEATLVVEDYKSSTRISGLSADLTLETYKGDVVVKDHKGEVRLETYKGEIDVTYRDGAYQSDYETYKGDISVHLPRSAAFDVRLDLGRRADLRTNFDIDDDDDWGRRDRKFRDMVNGGGPTLRFETHKGNIRIQGD